MGWESGAEHTAKARVGKMGRGLYGAVQVPTGEIWVWT
jgi:hypothetical protein